MQTDPIDRLDRLVKMLQRRNLVLTLLVSGLILVNAAILLAFTALKNHATPLVDSARILRVRGISVVDENGTERIRLGAPVPEPLILGKRFPRGGTMSGIILFDEEGNERSGYCTSDGYPNVLFTLDSIGRQHVLFMAEPQGDTTFRLWNGGNSFILDVGEETSELTLTRDGKPVWKSPPEGPKTPNALRRGK